MKIVVKEQAIRQFLREAMFSTGNVENGDVYDPASPSPVSVSDVVDPSAAMTDPSNPNYVPQSKAELKNALTALVASVPEDKVADTYKTVKDSIAAFDAEEDEKMNRKDTKLEAIIRLNVRKMLREAAGAHTDTGLSFSGHDGDRAGMMRCDRCEGIGTDPDTGGDCSACKGEGEVKKEKKYTTKSDRGDYTLQDYADAIGQLSGGKIGDIDVAKTILGDAFAKMRDRTLYIPPQVLAAELDRIFANYLNAMAETGEVTAEEIEFLSQHPDEFWDVASDEFRNAVDEKIEALARKYKSKGQKPMTRSAFRRGGA
jgi:hypothetical protein